MTSHIPSLHFDPWARTGRSGKVHKSLESLGPECCIVLSFSSRLFPTPTAHKSDRALMSIKEIIPHNNSLQCRYDLSFPRLKDLRSCTE